MNDAITFEKLKENIQFWANKIRSESIGIDHGLGDRTICYTLNATKDSKQRMFKKSGNRSKRTHKKLVKKFGGEFRKEPAIFKVGEMLLAHPAFRDEIDQQPTSER